MSAVPPEHHQLSNKCSAPSIRFFDQVAGHLKTSFRPPPRVSRRLYSLRNGEISTTSNRGSVAALAELGRPCPIVDVDVPEALEPRPGVNGRFLEEAHVRTDGGAHGLDGPRVWCQRADRAEAASPRTPARRSGIGLVGSIPPGLVAYGSRSTTLRAQIRARAGGGPRAGVRRETVRRSPVGFVNDP